MDTMSRAVKQVKQSETTNAVQETVEVPLWLLMVDCPTAGASSTSQVAGITSDGGKYAEALQHFQECG